MSRLDWFVVIAYLTWVLWDGIRQARNDGGAIGYTGPCIPRGEVNYKLRLIALDTMLDLPSSATYEQFIPAMNGHIVDVSEVPFFHYFKL